MTTSPLTPIIELTNVSKTFTLESGLELRVLQDLNLAVRTDEVIALLGPSGSGKSTVLRLMAGLQTPSSGSVLSHSKPLLGINLDIAFVFQSFALFPWKTTAENIQIAMVSQRMKKNTQKALIKQVIDLVGLEGFEEAYPRELSGGMKQRVGIARALAMQRPVLFLDEPFSALDILIAKSLREEIMSIFLEQKTSIQSMVMVTHNVVEAVYMARRILIMGSNPGFIKKELINHLAYPRDESSPAFLSMVATVQALITEAFIPDTPLQTIEASKRPKHVALEALPNVQITEIIGLLETIENEGGQQDIFELAQEIKLDYGRTLYIVKAGELLGLVETPQQMVVVTALGNQFLQADINKKKSLLHELFGNLRIVRMITGFLRKEENFRLSTEVLLERIKKWLPNENPHHILETIIAWGRFAEYFGYSDNRKEVYLDIGQETL